MRTLRLTIALALAAGTLALTSGVAQASPMEGGPTRYAAGGKIKADYFATSGTLIVMPGKKKFKKVRYSCTVYSMDQVPATPADIAAGWLEPWGIIPVRYTFSGTVKRNGYSARKFTYPLNTSTLRCLAVVKR